MASGLPVKGGQVAYSQASGSLAQAKGLGPKSSQWLHAVGITSVAELAELGIFTAYLRLEAAGFKPGLNMLYAMYGALHELPWQQVARVHKSELMTELARQRALRSEQPVPSSEE